MLGGPERRSLGMKRIRLIGAALAAVSFGMTAFQEFSKEPEAPVVLGVIINAIIGFAIVWIAVTVIGWIIRLVRGGGGDE